MNELNIFVEHDALNQAEYYQSILASRRISTTIVPVEKLNARFLRLHPKIALCVDEAGLWLSANGMKMQPDWGSEVARLRRATIKSEMIARACHLQEKPRILDATAGLGHDGLLMAYLGAEVELVERHPILFTLLEDAKKNAAKNDFLAPFIDRIHLRFTDSADYLLQLSEQSEKPDVIYLDPMFPQRDQNQQTIKKQAQVKKQMQLLHLLLPEQGEMDLGDRLLDESLKISRRVVVKRPRHSVFLSQLKPDHQWQGDACRFDVYFRI